MIAAGVCGLILPLSAVTQAHAGERKDPYPMPTSFGPFRFTSPSDEIAMARSAAPAAISDGTEVLTLGRQGYINDGGGHSHPHVMFFMPHTDGAAWGANSPGVPGFSQDVSPRATIFFVAVPKWSDASLALPEKH